MFNNFHYGLSLLDTIFGISMNEEDYEEVALVGWNLIGNKRCKLYRTILCLSNGQVELPCNCDQVEAVTTSFEDFQHVDNSTPLGRDNSYITEQYIEQYKNFNNPLYNKGKFLNYEKVGNTLYIDGYSGNINILYKGLVLDEDGLPEISEKEALALATYCAYVQKFKEGLSTNNATILQTATLLKQQWDTRCDQARIDYDWSQNDYDEILDFKTNHDRKIHSKSLKLLR